MNILSQRRLSFLPILGLVTGVAFASSSLAQSDLSGSRSSQDRHVIEALAAQMTLRLERDYWRRSNATLAPADVAMLCVTQAHRLSPLHDPLYAPDQAIRLRIDSMRRCFLAQGYREN